MGQIFPVHFTESKKVWKTQSNSNNSVPNNKIEKITITSFYWGRAGKTFTQPLDIKMWLSSVRTSNKFANLSNK